VADGQCVVHDQNSANGTYVNGQRITSQRVAHGDVIHFGPNAEFRVARPGRSRRWSRLLLPLLTPALRGRATDSRQQAGRTTPITRRVTVVGQDETADVILTTPLASPCHALVERTAGKLSVVDQRSQHGMRVNGKPVKQCSIGIGDVLTFADQSFELVATPRPSVLGLSLLLGAMLLSVSLVVLCDAVSSGAQLQTRQSHLDEAHASIETALAAFNNVPKQHRLARARLGDAVLSLIAADRLRPDRRSDDDIVQVLRQVSNRHKRQLRGEDLGAIYEYLFLGEEARPRAIPGPGESVVEMELAAILAEFGIDTRGGPLPPRLLEEVRRFVGFWKDTKRQYTQNTMRRAQPHLPMIREQLRRRFLPEVFSYVPFVESGYDPMAKSYAGARGMWQFMAGTARDFGLTVRGSVDERTDPLKSTEAAGEYLRRLLMHFGSDAFMCAIAAYNTGPGKVRRCLNRPGLDWRSNTKFLDIIDRHPDCLLQEQKEYVPRVLAAAIIMRHPEEFGFERPSGRR
jgi:pSer/pThr/pTyr-binding forkhead associated (FHA) protein